MYKTNTQISTSSPGYIGLSEKTVWLCPLTAFVLTCRVRLSKRRAKAGAQSTTNAVLVCKHRDMNEKELEAQVSVTFPFVLLTLHLSHLFLSFLSLSI